MGGDGMSGYSSTYAQETIGLRGYENGSIAGNGGYNSYGYAYSRLAMELEISVLAGAFLYDLRIGICGGW